MPTTGVDNNGDGANNDRPVVDGDGHRASRRSAAPAPRTSAVRRGPHQDRAAGRILLRLEGFNLFNHGNILGRAQTTYGDTATVNPTFGQVVAVGHGDQRAPGAGEHRSAADVPVPGEVYVLIPEFT